VCVSTWERWRSDVIPKRTAEPKMAFNVSKCPSKKELHDYLVIIYKAVSHDHGGDQKQVNPPDDASLHRGVNWTALLPHYGESFILALIIEPGFAFKICGSIQTFCRRLFKVLGLRAHILLFVLLRRGTKNLFPDVKPLLRPAQYWFLHINNTSHLHCLSRAQVGFVAIATLL